MTLRRCETLNSSWDGAFYACEINNISGCAAAETGSYYPCRSQSETVQEIWDWTITARLGAVVANVGQPGRGAHPARYMRVLQALRYGWPIGRHAASRVRGMSSMVMEAPLAAASRMIWGRRRGGKWPHAL